jgi:glycosyltransferase involved in cell wall biosynthesis
MMPSLALIVSTYNQPDHLSLCLEALRRQSCRDFELLIADDGSDASTERVISEYANKFNPPIQHLWQEDDGFRKTRILNRAILSTSAEYLVFMDGDCIAHPDFLKEHAINARPGHYLNGAMMRLSKRLTNKIDTDSIRRGDVFHPAWLSGKGLSYDRRYLRLSLGYRIRQWLNKKTLTELYWLGANSSCYREDALAINGFDNRFSYGYEDGDFGNRLENFGIRPSTIRWTANILHLYHGRPYSNPAVLAHNLANMTSKRSDGVYWIADGISSLTP